MLNPKQIHAHLSIKDARVEVRCTSTTKAEIEAIATRYGLTVTTYILRLHELAVKELEGK
jgi:antitoxin component of RelBE/YafQ-DinJ toxin-antitoxin module